MYYIIDSFSTYIFHNVDTSKKNIENVLRRFFNNVDKCVKKKKTATLMTNL